MKIVVSHAVTKNVVRVLQNTFDISDIEIVYADKKAHYDYLKEGWSKELRENMKKTLSEALSDESVIYFLAVGFIPAVLIAYDVVRELGKPVIVLTYDKERKEYDEIEWI